METLESRHLLSVNIEVIGDSVRITCLEDPDTVVLGIENDLLSVNGEVDLDATAEGETTRRIDQITSLIVELGGGTDRLVFASEPSEFFDFQQGWLSVDAELIDIQTPEIRTGRSNPDVADDCHLRLKPCIFGASGD